MEDINFLVTNWNRPQLTVKCVKNLINLGVKKIFVSIDGPRVGNLEDQLKIKKILDFIDFIKKNESINVITLEHKKNLGCRYAMQKSITWFFENVQEGIIIEDDVLINKSFVNFSKLLLKKYRNDYSIGAITANNNQPIWRKYKYDYYFSVFPHCWGWATWADRWKKFDDSMKFWPNLKRDNLELLDDFDDRFKKYWEERFDSVYFGNIDSWAIIWTYSLWVNKMLTCTPIVNMAWNQGLGCSGRKDGTHSKILIQKKQEECTIKKYQPSIKCSIRNDIYDQSTNYQPDLIRKISRKILRRRLFL